MRRDFDRSTQGVLFGPGPFTVRRRLPRLRKLQPGDAVTVDRADGSTVPFRVQRVEEYPKEHFPTRAVYGDVDGAELRPITCGGEFDPEARSYPGAGGGKISS